MIKRFAKLQVTDDGDILCSKCDKVLTRATVDYFRKNDDASDVWLIHLADDHFKQGCLAVMKDAKAKLDIVQDHSPDATLDDVYQLLI
jgi:hypothetical protein